MGAGHPGGGVRLLFCTSFSPPPPRLGASARRGGPNQLGIDAHIAFSFLTGVSKFAKASLFSGLNNPTDLTLDPAHAAICGYTEAELDTVFAELPGLDRDRIREWYNGYNWLGPDRVNIPSLDGLRSDDDLLSKFDVRYAAPEALLFQTGYLTIREEQTGLLGAPTYRLGYPNHEVRWSLNKNLLAAVTPPDCAHRNPDPRLVERLPARDFQGLGALLRGLFAGIPYEWHTRNEIARYEGYYASVFYAWLAAVGLDVTVEDSGAAGRADLAVRLDGNVYLFEFKVVEQAPGEAALAQLKAKGYADKYRHRAREVHLIGVEFSRQERNVVAFETERA